MRSFFKVPQRVHHALLLMTELAQRTGSGRAVTLQEVAVAAGISQGFLEQVALLLRRSGLIVGRRGAGGGYRLAVELKDLTVADVIAAVEGPVSVVECLGDHATCILAGSCSNRGVWAEINRQIMGTLSRMTLTEAAGLKPPKRVKKNKRRT